MNDFQRAHAESIGDAEPLLAPIPQARTARVLAAIPVRKPLVVVRQLIRTLKWQRLRSGTTLDVLFAPNYSETDPDREAVLAELADSGFGVLPNRAAPTDDYGEGPASRAWTKPAFARMAAIKNDLLARALHAGYEYCWLLDADVMCGPETLQSMLDAASHTDRIASSDALQQPIVSAVYWTDWQRKVENRRQHAGPQVWLVHPYILEGRGMTEPEFRRKLITRQRVQVWGLGACTLIPSTAIAKGVNFSRVPGLDPAGMGDGEDRHFCANATRLHVELIADAWPDIYHAYHPVEYDRLEDEVDALETVPNVKPDFGDLVSARINVLEPIPDGTGRFMRPPPEWIRGRLGALNVMPQLEEALANMSVGDSIIINLLYGADHPARELHGGSARAELTLYDVKPFRVPPVIDRELFIGQRTGRLMDHTTLTHDQIMEVAGNVEGS